MTWADFYLGCFIVGFGLSLLSLLAGSVHLHLPHLHMHLVPKYEGGAAWGAPFEMMPANKKLLSEAEYLSLIATLRAKL